MKLFGRAKRVEALERHVSELFLRIHACEEAHEIRYRRDAMNNGGYVAFPWSAVQAKRVLQSLLDRQGLKIVSDPSARDGFALAEKGKSCPVIEPKFRDTQESK